MKVSEIKDLTIAELQERISTEKEKLLHMKLNHSISPLENPMLIRDTRRTIARLMTILNQRTNNK